jgi:hypothetical protein
MVSTRLRIRSSSFCSLERGCCCCEAWTRRSRSFCSSSWVISLLLIGIRITLRSVVCHGARQRKNFSGVTAIEFMRDVIRILAARLRSRVTNRQRRFACGISRIARREWRDTTHCCSLKPAMGGVVSVLVISGTAVVVPVLCLQIPDRPGSSGNPSAKVAFLMRPRAKQDPSLLLS